MSNNKRTIVGGFGSLGPDAEFNYVAFPGGPIAAGETVTLTTSGDGHTVPEPGPVVDVEFSEVGEERQVARKRPETFAEIIDTLQTWRDTLEATTDPAERAEIEKRIREDLEPKAGAKTDNLVRALNWMKGQIGIEEKEIAANKKAIARIEREIEMLRGLAYQTLMRSSDIKRIAGRRHSLLLRACHKKHEIEVVLEAPEQIPEPYRQTILRGCPFCGRQPLQEFTEESVKAERVMCMPCGATTGWAHTAKEAIEKWNTRATDVGQAVVYDLEAIKAKLMAGETVTGAKLTFGQPVLVVE